MRMDYNLAIPTPASSILVVEDSDAKYQSIIKVVTEYFGASALVERASTLMIAEAKIVERPWNLLVLDISLDITLSSAGPKKGGHATLGGMDIAQRIYLLDLDIKTIIVTAFDAFQTGAQRDGYTILGLEDIERRAKEILGELFIGCVRYGDTNWKISLQDLFRKAN